MPHEKRAPLGYFEYSLLGNSKRKEETGRGHLPSSAVDGWSDSSCQGSSRPAASQSSSHTTPDSIPSSHQLNHANGPYLETLQGHLHRVDVPSWRERVLDEKPDAPPALPPSQRQHPRRTAPACHQADSRHISAPPALLRQPEKRQCFVSCLVIFAAGLIAAIWPLSAPVLHDATYAHNVLPLQDFITETLRRSKTSYSTLQIAMYYLILLKDHLPGCDFTKEQSCVPNGRRAMQCGRRMFLSALMLASKFLQDRNYSTRAWGKITGLPASEINTNEVRFLEAVDWKLHVSKEKFERWSHTVIALSAPPKPGMWLIPQPSLVETLGWSAVLGRLTPDCHDDFSHLGGGLPLPRNVYSPSDPYGVLTPPSSPPDSTDGDQDDPSHKAEVKHVSLDVEGVGDRGRPCPAPPPAPHQPNLPTPRDTPGLGRCPSSRTGQAPLRCQESSSAMSMLKLCARPTNRALCPPPAQRLCPPFTPAMQSSASRKSSISTTAHGLSPSESLQSDPWGFDGRSRSSSISSVASLAVSASMETDIVDVVPKNGQPTSCLAGSDDPPKIDCSSMLRAEEYGAADALLRFHMASQRSSNQDQDTTFHRDLTKPELVKRSKHQDLRGKMCSPSSAGKKKKRRYSNANVSDLLDVTEDSMQTIVRKHLMTSGETSPSAVLPDVDVREVTPKQCKRTRSTRDQLSAVEFARILLKDQQKENGSLSTKCRPSVQKVAAKVVRR